MRDIGRGDKVFDAAPVVGTLRVMEDVGDVLALLDEMEGVDGSPPSTAPVVVLVRDAGATFLAPVFAELAGVICTAGTLRSHIGIVAREFGVPAVMGATFDEPATPGESIELDCSGEEGVIRA